MTENAYIRLKLSLCHEPRNENRSVSEVEERVKRMLNHPDEQVTDLRIAVGRAAGAVFLHLKCPKGQGKFSPVRWTQESIDSLKRQTVRWMERERYADDIFITDSRFDIVSGEQENS